MMMKKRNVPVCWMPSRKLTLMLAPLASGDPSVIVPEDRVEFIPPPLGWAGGASSVVASTLTVQGGAPAPEAVHVVASLTAPTLSLTPVRARRSAVPGALGKVVMSIIRKRSRVTGAPVLLTIRRLMVMVPNVELFGASD